MMKVLIQIVFLCPWIRNKYNGPAVFFKDLKDRVPGFWDARLAGSDECRGDSGKIHDNGFHM
jgi:hypothetical protein